MRFHHAIAIVAIVSTATVASAAMPSAALFKTINHDFGTVAKAAKAEFRFELTNPFDQPIHIRGVRTSCGCTTPIVETETIQPGETGTIMARFNTGSFQGARAATLTVSFDRPSFTEVQLHVKGYIRSDVVLAPGEANFGNVGEGEPKTIQLTVDYAGRSDWAIVGLQTADDFLKARATELKRNNGRVSYQLEIDLLANAPAGALMSEIIIQTNDRNLKTVPLVVNANIESDISVSPRMLELVGTDSVDSFKQVLILKGKTPFKIMNVESDDFDITADPSEDSKALHTLPMTLVPKIAGRKVDGKILVTTDSKLTPTIELNALYTAP